MGICQKRVFSDVLLTILLKQEKKVWHGKYLVASALFVFHNNVCSVFPMIIYGMEWNWVFDISSMALQVKIILCCSVRSSYVTIIILKNSVSKVFSPFSTGCFFPGGCLNVAVGSTIFQMAWKCGIRLFETRIAAQPRSIMDTLLKYNSVRWIEVILLK